MTVYESIDTDTSHYGYGNGLRITHTTSKEGLANRAEANRKQDKTHHPFNHKPSLRAKHGKLYDIQETDE